MTFIRRETEGDAPLIHTLHDAAFATVAYASGTEAAIVDALRGSEDWVPQLSLVAEADGRPAGHVVCSYGRLGERRILGLGPIGVDPSLHGKGIGSALMHAAIAAADALDEPAIILLGNPDYYGRFGFESAAPLGIEPEDPSWGSAFQIRRLAGWSDDLRGRYTYSPGFGAQN
ncbi:GNAT family N-acetyltransferase [Glycomyces sp. YM15]|uniref:GNAT family N-acetyltransferase n=1 Tax=Glycomyces sp. YM15 TaxID=2800446 RepID=UPI00196698B3|nr:N-acetyltransferase [Glycomyces sp. YM15]